MSDKLGSVPTRTSDLDEKIKMPAEPTDAALVERANQVYKAYLDAIYNLDLYRADQDRTLTWSRGWDYIIGLSAAISGGSGLGILADPRLAWLCGGITTASIFLTVAKGTYDWPGRLKFDTERISDYNKLRLEWQYLKEDLDKTRNWMDDLKSGFWNCGKPRHRSRKDLTKRLA
jgi:hypothetical protein